jgi:hypothetical protein
VQVDQDNSTVILDTSGGAWVTPVPGTLSGEDVTRRCRHAVTSVGPFVFIFGGLKGSTLLDDLLLAGVCVCEGAAACGRCMCERGPGCCRACRLRRVSLRAAPVLPVPCRRRRGRL